MNSLRNAVDVNFKKPFMWKGVNVESQIERSNVRSSWWKTSRINLRQSVRVCLWSDIKVPRADKKSRAAGGLYVKKTDLCDWIAVNPCGLKEFGKFIQEKRMPSDDKLTQKEIQNVQENYIVWSPKFELAQGWKPPPLDPALEVDIPTAGTVQSGAATDMNVNHRQHHNSADEHKQETDDIDMTSTVTAEKGSGAQEERVISSAATTTEQQSALLSVRSEIPTGPVASNLPAPTAPTGPVNPPAPTAFIGPVSPSAPEPVSFSNPPESPAVSTVHNVQQQKDALNSSAQPVPESTMVVVQNPANAQQKQTESAKAPEQQTDDSTTSKPPRNSTAM